MASSLVLNRSPKVPAQDTAAFGAIAERFRRAGALDKAVSLCREGLKKFPDHVSARVTLGWSLLDLGQYDEARTELELVLRRAPDNLAAIRGLAELHDRFEHTLNLPMDGPGQWPPAASEVDEFTEAPIVVAAAAEFELAPLEAPVAVSHEPEGTGVMVPADMGMPIWSPVAAAPVASSPTSGMSSVREIDFPVAAPAEASIAPAAPAAPDEVGVDLAALIAEAESLEAAAQAAIVTADFEAVSLDQAPAVDLVADVDLSANEDLAAQLQIDEGVELGASSLIETDLPVTIELAATEDGPESLAFSEPDVVAELFAAEFAAAPETVHMAEPAPLAVEPAALAAEPAALVVEPAAVAMEPAAEVVETAEQPEPEFANVLAFAPVAAETTAHAATRTATPHPALPALERMLAKVQARRLQLMAESVA